MMAGQKGRWADGQMDRWADEQNDGRIGEWKGRRMYDSLMKEWKAGRVEEKRPKGGKKHNTGWNGE